MPYLVVVSDAGREKACRDEVRDLGLKTYLPTFREQIVTRGRRVWTERSLLGRYFFAHHDGADTWRTIPSLKSAFGLFMRHDTELPALVRDSVIEDLRAREDRSGHVTLPPKGFSKGARVVPTAGVMQGIEGIFQRLGRGGCEVAVLELFGRPTRVEFAPGVLRAA